MNLTKISDIAKDLQTEKFKLKIYRMVEQFVYKNYRHYYPHFDGELHDLVLDLFTDFCRPKKRRNGETFSELDRVEPSKVGGGEWTGDDDKAIATYVQRFVIHHLIDKERTDKGEVRASETYQEGGAPSFDYLASKGQKSSHEALPGAYQENIEYKFYDLMDNPQAIKNAKVALANNPEQVKRIKFLTKHYGDKLDPQVREFIDKLLEAPEAKVEKVDFTTIQDLLPEATIIEYPLHGRPAVKVVADIPEEKQDLVKNAFDKLGYEFNKTWRGNWYFFKKQELSDSLIVDARAGGIDQRTGKKMSREEALNYDGPSRKFVSVEAYLKENPVEGVDFIWVDKDGNELPDFHAVTDASEVDEIFTVHEPEFVLKEWESLKPYEACEFVKHLMKIWDLLDVESGEEPHDCSIKDFVEEYNLSYRKVFDELMQYLSDTEKEELKHYLETGELE